MKFLRYSNVPIVGRYVPVSDAENAAIDAALSDNDRRWVMEGGWAVVDYTYINKTNVPVRYYGASVRADLLTGPRPVREPATEEVEG